MIKLTLIETNYSLNSQTKNHQTINPHNPDQKGSQPQEINEEQKKSNLKSLKLARISSTEYAKQETKNNEEKQMCFEHSLFQSHQH